MNEKIFLPENTEDENRAIVEQMVSNFDDLMEPFVVCINIFYISFSYLTVYIDTIKSVIRFY